jgi:hypothetical protein
METSLDPRIADLQQKLTALEEDGALSEENSDAMEIVRTEMEALLRLPGGASALVARHGADLRVAVARPLAFSLAVEVNQRARARELSSTVLEMISKLRTSDPWTKVNLCTAVQRLLIFGAITAEEVSSGTSARDLLRFLSEALDGPPELRATAATVVADLFYRRRQAMMPGEEVARLGEKLLKLENDEDELTRQEAQGLRELFEGGRLKSRS